MRSATKQEMVTKRKLNLIEYTIRDLGYSLAEVQGIYEDAIAGADILTQKELVKYIEDRIEMEVY